jgi:hypothetical protein
MKFSGKPILVSLIILLLASQVNAIDLTSLQSNVNSFAEDMSKALPFYSTIGLNWSDAYIGNFPSFGVGLSAGLTTIDSKSINKLLDNFGIDIKNIPIISDIGFPLPNYVIDARIGVPSIPLDFGIKGGYLHPSLLKSFLGTGIKSTLIGADVRYAFVNSKIIPMRLSVGLGVNYLDGGISKEFETLKFTNSGSDFDVEKPTVDITWKTLNVELKLQASFPYKIITPYAGAGVIYAFSSQAGYKISSPKSIPLDTTTLKKSGVTNTSEKSFETIIKNSDIKSGINTRVFGGLSFNLGYVRLDLTGMYEILNNNFGATLGLRFQK